MPKLHDFIIHVFEDIEDDLLPADISYSVDKLAPFPLLCNCKIIVTIIYCLSQFHGTNGSVIIICRHDDFVFTQKLAFVLQTLPIELIAYKISPISAQ